MSRGACENKVETNYKNVISCFSQVLQNSITSA